MLSDGLFFTFMRQNVALTQVILQFIVDVQQDR